MKEFAQALRRRYGESVGIGKAKAPHAQLSEMIARGSCRDFAQREVDTALVELLCATALASPTKSDLQQRDIVVMRDPSAKARLVELVSGESWVRRAPCLIVFCGNNRRQRRLHELRGHPFVNDHLDAFFNAAVDAGIALSAFVTAAEAVGLGCCPISAVRNEAAAVSELLGLPEFVFPVAGLAFGYPANPVPTVSMRLPLHVTVHTDRYSEEDLDAAIADYDRRREKDPPDASQRAVGRFGISETYGWSEDKARQYGLPERSSFGDFIRSNGFNLS